MKNLFGQEDDFKVVKPAQGEYQIFKRRNNYRKSTDTQMCGNCFYSVYCDYHNKNYWKCKLMGVSHSEASDIRKSYICNKHKERKGR